MAGDLVLLTGATGHLGFRTLRTALEHGYKVRAVVRSDAKAKLVRSNPVLKALNVDEQLSFVLVPDFSTPGAFDEVVKVVKYIIHIASPIASSETPSDADFEKHFVDAAVQGTISVFESARKAETVKRIVITSSVVAIMDPKAAFYESVDQVFDADSRIPDLKPPFPDPMFAYAASKIAAFNSAEAWVEREKPAFDVVYIHPSFIFGRDDMVDSTKSFTAGTNKIPLEIALGTADATKQKSPNIYCNVEDAAKSHVLALDPKIEGDQSFIVSNTGMDGMTYEQTNEIVAKYFPDAVKDGRLPNTGDYGLIVAKLDVSKTEKTFGVKFATYEETVVSLIGHYLELLEKESSKPTVNGH